MSFFLFLSYLSFFSHFLLHSCHASLLFPFSKSLVSKFLPSVHLSHFMSNFLFLLSTHQFLFVNVLSSLHFLPFVSILCFYRWSAVFPIPSFIFPLFIYFKFPFLPSCLFSSFQECSYWKKREGEVREADYRCLPLFAWLCFKSKYLLLPFCCCVLIIACLIIMDVCVYLINVSLANCSWHFLSQFLFL